MTFKASVFWPAARQAGMLRLASVKQSGALRADVWVGYLEPDTERLVGAGRSRDYAIEYQVADLPRLKEGDPVTIWADESKTQGTGARFEVREPPINAEDADGTFRYATLSRL